MKTSSKAGGGMWGERRGASVWQAGLALAACWCLAACQQSARAPAASSPAVAPAPSGAAPSLAPEAPSGWSPKPGWTAQRHMVATAHPLATDAALAVLRDGGSAVDAAITAQMMLTLVEPQSSGIGGGLFMVLRDGARIRALDGRETAPAAVTPELFMSDGRPLPFAQAVVGGRAVGTPGVIAALEAAHREHGRLPWARLFDAAIATAQRGFTVTPRLATLLRDPSAQTLMQDPAARALFRKPDGTWLAAGDSLRNPALAATLKQLAQGGSRAFYRGPLAESIVATVRGHAGNPGRMSVDDLANYRPVWREPLCFDHGRYRLCGMPPPSSGTLAIAQMLGILQAHGQRTGLALSTLAPLSAPWGRDWHPEALHRVSEAGRLVFADRNRYVADTDFVPLPGGSARALLHPRYLAERAALIGPRSMGRALPGVPMSEVMALADDQSQGRGGTSHVSVVDAQGQAVSMTTTIEAGWGAQIMVGGFLLNNQLTDFSFVPVEDGKPVANRVEPRKRPRSSMVPLLVFEREADGRLGPLVMTLGSPGGSAIIPYVAKVLLGTLDWGMDVQQAIDLPNAGSRNGPTELEALRSTPALANALRERGHEVRVMPQTSGLQAIQRPRLSGAATGWLGGADPRRDGTVGGD